MLTQVSFFAENKKGAMNRITSLISDAGINVSALVTNDSAEFGIVRLIAEDPEKTLKLLTDEGYMCRLDPVIAVNIGDEPGSLNRLLSDITSSNINIDYLYLSYNRELGNPIAVFHAHDFDEMEDFLTARGFVVI